MENAGKFKPGNPGKPKGATNKVNRDLRAKVDELLELKFDDFIKAFNKLTPRYKVQFYIELLSFNLPKLKHIESEINFNQLNEESINQVINGILKNTDNE